ncbi:Uncharacterised protein [Mycobacterium tuberculosis]|uniref:Uncharacterized protein n=1 Tax=Mycobacterium tuberculosis TaxID=1773 RepID=A0A655APX8_MYCTX|nr:Uncharacterised protein [Mycobacterium tuberculosis]CNU58330.1 Uncharacterised protein [Mycobacterium tuberculosis]
MRSIGRPPDVMNRTTKAAAITRKMTLSQVV